MSVPDQPVANPRWWGFDSESSVKDAIEKASKVLPAAALHRDFRRDRHQHFGKISGFAGTSEELFTHIGKVLDGFEGSPHAETAAARPVAHAGEVR